MRTRVGSLLVMLASVVGLVAGPPTAARAASGPSYEIEWDSTGLAVDSLGTTVWQTLATTSWAGRASQVWVTNVVANPWSWSVNAESGLCMVTGGAARIGDPVVQGACGYNGYSEWGNVAAPGPWTGRVHIVNRATGLCVGIGAVNGAGEPTLELQRCSQAGPWWVYRQVG